MSAATSDVGLSCRDLEGPLAGVVLREVGVGLGLGAVRHQQAAVASRRLRQEAGAGVVAQRVDASCRFDVGHEPVDERDVAGRELSQHTRGSHRSRVTP